MMYDFMKESVEKANIGNAQIVFVQPLTDCNPQKEEDFPDDELAYLRYSSYSPSEWYYLTCLRNRAMWSDNMRPIFMTNSGYQNCTWSSEITYVKEECEKISNNLRDSKRASSRQRKTGRAMEPCLFEFINEDDEESLENDTIATSNEVKFQLSRSASYDTSSKAPVYKSSRRVSILVDELLLKIYGDRERRCSGGTDIHTFEGSTDSSNNNIFKSKSSLLRKKRSFTGIPEDKCKRWDNMVRTRLMNKSVTELKTLKATLEYNLSHIGSQLIRQLKRRDFLYSRRDAQCCVITAFLQAVSAKRNSLTAEQRTAWINDVNN